MRYRSQTTATITVLTAVLVIGGLVGQTRASAADDQASPWRFEFNSWLWLYGITGDIGVGTATADVDASFFDILDGSDSIFAFAGRLEIGYDRFGAFIDGTYAKIEVDDASGSAGLASIDVTLELGVVDFGGMYRIAEWDVAESSRDGTIDLYAGGRYFTIDVEFDPAMAASRSAGRDWVDPIIGAKLRQPLSPDLHLGVWGDIGGFGVASDLTWSVTGVLGYDFMLFDLPMTVYGGYRAIGWDYEDGSGTDRAELDAILHGPTLGFQIRF